MPFNESTVVSPKTQIIIPIIFTENQTAHTQRCFENRYSGERMFLRFYTLEDIFQLFSSFIIDLFIYLAASGLCGMRGFHCVQTVAVVRGLSFSEACGILVIRPGLEPRLLHLQGGFLITAPPGKSLGKNFK